MAKRSLARPNTKPQPAKPASQNRAASLAQRRSLSSYVQRGTWRPVFLEALSQLANIGYACQVAGINRTTAYNAKERDPDFARAWDEALEDAGDKLEREVWRRAHDGVPRVKLYIHQGAEVARVVELEYSDQLLLALLRKVRPAQWVEKHQVMMAARVQVGNLEDVTGVDWKEYERVFAEALGLEPADPSASAIEGAYTEAGGHAPEVHPEDSPR